MQIQTYIITYKYKPSKIKVENKKNKVTIKLKLKNLIISSLFPAHATFGIISLKMRRKITQYSSKKITQ